jgi:hypothetical protein
MAWFVVSDSSGNIQSAFQVTDGADLAAALTANTPAGMVAVVVNQGDPSIFKPLSYKVQNGAVVLK